MPETKPLFDTDFQNLQRARRAATQAANPLYETADSRLKERLADIKRAFPRRGLWPYAPQQPYDLLTSCLALQEENDIEQTLAAIYDHLAPGGLFLGVLAGGESLHEMRVSLMEAEIVLTGGASPRIMPMAQAEDMARLLPRAGFALPVVDVERIELIYPDLLSLMNDLRFAGTANALAKRSRSFAPRELFEKASQIYASRFPAPHGGIIATADLIFLHGWKE